MIKKGHFTQMNREEFFKFIMELKVSRKITHVQNHHTYLPNYDTCKKYSNLQLVENMERYHKETNGWDAIAQQISTFPDGSIVVGGRSFDSDPAGIKNHNKGGICIENVGDFDKGKDIMTDEQKKTILFVDAVLHFKFNLPINTTTNVYHCWFASKTCPGTNWFGGNTEEAAQKYFYPLLQAELDKLKGIKPTSSPSPVKPVVKPAPAAPAKSSSALPLLKKGSKGEYVKRVQKVIGTAVDGDFGPNTEKAVIAFQRNHKLTADGIVGANTWDKIVEVENTPKTFLIKVLANSLYTYKTANWNNKGQIVKKDEVFTVVRTLTVAGYKMYQIKSGLYITANPKYVKVI